MNVQDMTPGEIDAILAALWDKAYAAEDALGRAWNEVHYAAADQRSSRTGWRMTNADALAAAHTQAAQAIENGRPWRAEEINRSIDTLTQRIDAAHAADAACHPYEAEYARRPWARFFVVADGHIHSSQGCSTCHKGGQRTRFTWTPDLSGKTMAEAIAYFEAQAKGRSEVLCSVCFPDAPREWMVRPADPDQCPGSGTRDYDATAKTSRRGYGAGNGAVCTHCGEFRAVSSRGFGKLVKHRKA